MPMPVSATATVIQPRPFSCACRASMVIVPRSVNLLAAPRRSRSAALAPPLIRGSERWLALADRQWLNSLDPLPLPRCCASASSACGAAFSGVSGLLCDAVSRSAPGRQRALIYHIVRVVVQHSKFAPVWSGWGLGCAKTKSDLVLMPSERQVFAFFCSAPDHRPQNSGCSHTAQRFHTAWVIY
jgi:hypothetical protein